MAEADLTMFFGEFEHNVDDKNRLCINSSYRTGMSPDELEKGFVITKGYDGCLALYPVDNFTALSNEIAGNQFNDADARSGIRELFRKAVRVSIDSQGRIVIPQKLREEVGITKVCVENGVLGHIELWAKKAHGDYWDENADEAAQTGGPMPF